jgi:hypothetical protein
MVTINIVKDEVYPVYKAVAEGEGGWEISLTEKEFNEFCTVTRRYNKFQKLLEKKYNKAYNSFKDAVILTE